MFDWGSGESGYLLSIMPDDTPAIDYVLDGDVVKKIYGSWDEALHGELVDYGGGVRAITSRMLASVGREFLTGLKGIGSVRAAVILEAVHDVLGEMPYGSNL